MHVCFEISVSWKHRVRKKVN